MRTVRKFFEAALAIAAGFAVTLGALSAAHPEGTQSTCQMKINCLLSLPGNPPACLQWQYAGCNTLTSNCPGAGCGSHAPCNIGTTAGQACQCAQDAWPATLINAPCSLCIVVGPGGMVISKLCQPHSCVPTLCEWEEDLDPTGTSGGNGDCVCTGP